MENITHSSESNEIENGCVCLRHYGRLFFEFAKFEKLFLHLTKVKRLEVITFTDKRYVSFEQSAHYQEKKYKYYINFNDDEWATFLGKMANISNKLFGEEECMKWRGMKTSIYLDVDKRMERFKLTKKELATVLSHNAKVQK